MSTNFRSPEITSESSDINFQFISEKVVLLANEMKNIPGTVESKLNIRMADIWGANLTLEKVTEFLKCVENPDLMIQRVNTEFSQFSLTSSPIEMLDRILVLVANSEISNQAKKNFFSNFGLLLHKEFQAKVVEQYMGETGVSVDCPLPIEISYVLNKSALISKGDQSMGITENIANFKLRGIKSQIKV